MAISDFTSSLKPKVTFTDAETVYHLRGTLDCAHRENDRIILQNNALEKEVKELRSVHINQDKLKEKVAFLKNIVNYYKQLEINLRESLLKLRLRFEVTIIPVLKRKRFSISKLLVKLLE